LIVTSVSRVTTFVLNVSGCLRGRPRRSFLPVKISSTLSGRPRSRLSATNASKNPRAWRGASKTSVRETSICRIDSSHQ